MNHWWEVDGARDAVIEPGITSSEAVQQFLPDARVVKGLNHMGYHDLEDGARGRGEPGRKAIAIAGERRKDVAIVSELVDRLGFDPLRIGPLSVGVRLEPGAPAFGVNVGVDELRALTGADDTDVARIVTRRQGRRRTTDAFDHSGLADRRAS